MAVITIVGGVEVRDCGDGDHFAICDRCDPPTSSWGATQRQALAVHATHVERVHDTV